MVKNIKNYDGLDVLKLILAISVVAIHSKALPVYFFGRLAVPFFFITTGFFIFKKINSSRMNDHASVISRQLVRLGRMILFWTVLFIPITLYVSNIKINDIPMDFLQWILTGGFPGWQFDIGWFLTATFWGIIVVYYLNKCIGIKKTLFIGIIIEILLIMFTHYTMVGSISNFFRTIIMYSAARSILYIQIGYIFAKYERKIQIRHPYILFLTFFSLAVIEMIYGIIFNVGIGGDETIFVPFSAVLVFYIGLKSNKYYVHAESLRKLSSFMYPAQPLAFLVADFLGLKNQHLFTLQYLVYYNLRWIAVVIIIVMLYVVVRFLLKFKIFDFLKYSM